MSKTTWRPPNWNNPYHEDAVEHGCRMNYEPGGLSSVPQGMDEIAYRARIFEAGADAMCEAWGNRPVTMWLTDGYSVNRTKAGFEILDGNGKDVVRIVYQ